MLTFKDLTEWWGLPLILLVVIVAGAIISVISAFNETIFKDFKKSIKKRFKGVYK